MEFLVNSLLELITQTSTNLPPDVRAAMGIALERETPGTQSHQALNIIAANIDMALRGRRPHLPGHRHAHLHRAHARRRQPDRRSPKPSAKPWPKPPNAASCAPTRWTPSPARTPATTSAPRRRSFTSSSGSRTRSKSS